MTNLSVGSLRGGSRDLRPHHDHRLAAPDRGLAPRLPPLRGEGGAGVRESRHLQVRRQPGAFSTNTNIDHKPLVCLKTDTPLS